MSEEKHMPPVPEGDGLGSGNNPGDGPTQSKRDYVPPHGADAVEPDHPPMRLLTITIVVLAIVVIGTGIALGEWLQLSTREERERKQVSEYSELKQLQESSATTLQSYGYDEDKKLHRIPLKDALSFLAANPDRVETPSLWPELKTLDAPEPKDGKGN